MEKKKTRILVECALMIAMATVLGFVPLFQMPQGGTVTLFSMVPLVVASFRHGTKWGLLTGAVYGVIQTLLGLENVMYAATLPAMAACVLLDYLLAYAAMGLTASVAKPIPNRLAGVAAGTAVTGLLRYACSFLSGILIWAEYAPEGTPVWLYSLTYNGSYMIPEILVTVVGAVAAAQALAALDKARNA